jgi:hypothetical protein
MEAACLLQKILNRVFDLSAIDVYITRKRSQGTVPIFAARKTLPRQQAFSPRKWDCPPRAVEGDRSMFSADAFRAKHAFPPENGPVPSRPVNGHILP